VQPAYNPDEKISIKSCSKKHVLRNFLLYLNSDVTHQHIFYQNINSGTIYDIYLNESEKRFKCNNLKSIAKPKLFITFQY